jgi:acyl-CoA thioesterase FadM
MTENTWFTTVMSHKGLMSSPEVVPFHHLNGRWTLEDHPGPVSLCSLFRLLECARLDYFIDKSTGKLDSILKSAPKMFVRSQECFLEDQFRESSFEGQTLKCQVCIGKVGSSSFSLLIFIHSEQNEFLGVHETVMVAVDERDKKFVIPEDHAFRKLSRLDLQEKYSFTTVDIKSLPPTREPDYVYPFSVRPQDLDQYVHVNHVQQLAFVLDALDMAVSSRETKWDELRRTFLTSPAASFHNIDWKHILTVYDGQVKLSDSDLSVSIWILENGFFCWLSRKQKHSVIKVVLIRRSASQLESRTIEPSLESREMKLHDGVLEVSAPVTLHHLYVRLATPADQFTAHPGPISLSQLFSFLDSIRDKYIAALRSHVELTVARVSSTAYLSAVQLHSYEDSFPGLFTTSGIIIHSNSGEHAK